MTVSSNQIIIIFMLGAFGNYGITSVWKDHFHNIRNSVNDRDYRDMYSH